MLPLDGFCEVIFVTWVLQSVAGRVGHCITYVKKHNALLGYACKT